MKPTYFEIVPREFSLNTTQQNVLMNSFADLHPYLTSCYPIYHHCPKTQLQHVSIVFNFHPSKPLDLSTLTEKTKQQWKLTDLQTVLNKDKNEKWIDGCKVYVGIPPIQRGLPSDLIYEIFGTQHHKFHLEEEFWDCY